MALLLFHTLILFLTITHISTCNEIINPTATNVYCLSNENCNVLCNQTCTAKSIYCPNDEQCQFICETGVDCTDNNIYAMNSRNFLFKCFGDCDGSELHIILKNESSNIEFECSDYSCRLLELYVDINSQNIVYDPDNPILSLPSIEINCFGESSCWSAKFYISSLSPVTMKCYGGYACIRSELVITSFDYSVPSLRSNVTVECFAYESCEDMIIIASTANYLNITCDQQNTSYTEYEWLYEKWNCADMVIFAPNYVNDNDPNIYLNCNSYITDYPQCENLLVFAMYGRDQFEYRMNTVLGDSMTLIYGSRYNKKCFVGVIATSNSHSYYYPLYFNILAPNQTIDCDSIELINTEFEQYNVASLKGNVNSLDIGCDDIYNNTNCLVFSGRKQNQNNIIGWTFPESISCGNAINCFIWCTFDHSCDETKIYTDQSMNLYLYSLDSRGLEHSEIYFNLTGGNIYIGSYSSEAWWSPSIWCSDCNTFYLYCSCPDSCDFGYFYLNNTNSITFECTEDAMCDDFDIYIKADINEVIDLRNINNVVIKNGMYLSPIPYHRIKWICEGSNGCRQDSSWNDIHFIHGNESYDDYYWYCTVNYWNGAWYCDDYPLYVSYPYDWIVSPTVDPTIDPTVNPTTITDTPSIETTLNPVSISTTITTTTSISPVIEEDNSNETILGMDLMNFIMLVIVLSLIILVIGLVVFICKMKKRKQKSNTNSNSVGITNLNSSGTDNKPSVLLAQLSSSIDQVEPGANSNQNINDQDGKYTYTDVDDAEELYENEGAQVLNTAGMTPIGDTTTGGTDM